MWQLCHLPVDLHWERVRFGEPYSVDVPVDSFGIYAFMLTPEAQGAPSTAYLLYVGMTERPFRTRYKEYLLEDSSDWAIRPIYRALDKWRDYIWFHFAPMEDLHLLESIEETLINACIPPCNVKFTGTIGRAISAFVRDPEG